MSDPRPRPQYGEYATPEQQAAARGQAAPPPTVVPEPNVPPPPYGAALDRHGPPTTERLAPRGDAPLSVALLALGLLNVLLQVFAPPDYASTIDSMYKSYGVSGTYQVTDLTATLAQVVTISYIVIYLVVLFVTVQLLRARRRAFWVPLVGGVLAAIVAGVCAGVLLYADPAFMAYLTSVSGG